MDLPNVSVIVCSRNRPTMLVESVDSILRGNEVPREIVIVDQSDVSNPRLAQLDGDRSCTVRYVWTESRGLSAANNLGVAEAHHDVLVFTHDDVTVAPEWLGSLVRALVSQGLRSVVTGQVRPSEAEAAGGFAPSTKTDEAPAVYSGRIGIDILFPMNMAMYRSAVEEVGGFDRRLGPGTPFPAAEDNDFGFRLLEAGYRIVYAPEAVLIHRAWRAPRDYLPLRWAYGTGQGGYYAKYADLRDRYMLQRMSADLIRHFRAILSRLRTGDPFGAASSGAYSLGVLYGAARWWLTQSRAP